MDRGLFVVRSKIRFDIGNFHVRKQIIAKQVFEGSDQRGRASVSFGLEAGVCSPLALDQAVGEAPCRVCLCLRSSCSHKWGSGRAGDGEGESLHHSATLHLMFVDLSYQWN